MKTFLYIRGAPGSGKITVARLLEQRLGWKLFWFHDLKNAIYNVVREHRIPRLMDTVTVPVLKHLMDKGEDVIYVRPSPDRKTVQNIKNLVDTYPDYRFMVVRLDAPYDTLHARVISRQDPYRITTKEALDGYLNERSTADIENEIIVSTDGLTVEAVSERILGILNLEQ